MCKIVIIEDDIDICNMIKKFLENFISNFRLSA